MDGVGADDFTLAVCFIFFNGWLLPPTCAHHHSSASTPGCQVGSHPYCQPCLFIVTPEGQATKDQSPTHSKQYTLEPAMNGLGL